MTVTKEPAPQKRGAPLQLGRIALGLLVVTLASGAALVPLYDPADARSSMEAIHSGLPWAWILRGLHGFGGHGLLVVTLGHMAEVYLVKNDLKLTPGVWWRSVLLLPLLVMAMLSGFVLQAGPDAAAALQIWRGILSSIPLAGQPLTALLVGPGRGSLAVILVHHAGTFSLLIWVLAAEHGGRLWPDRRAAVISALGCLALAGLATLPLGPAAAPDGALLLGPWYLLGLQGALMDLPRAAGWTGPALLVATAGVVRHLDGRRRRAAVAILAAMVIAYAGFTVRLLVAS